MTYKCKGGAFLDPNRCIIHDGGRMTDGYCDRGRPKKRKVAKPGVVQSELPLSFGAKPSDK